MPQSCPKCGSPKAEYACPRCGLVYEKYSPDRAFSEVPAELEALWQQVEANWDERSLHAVFLETCLARGLGGYAAARYRTRQGDPIAEAQVGRLVLRVEQSLVPSTAPRKHSRLWLVLSLLATLLMLGLGLILATKRCFRG